MENKPFQNTENKKDGDLRGFDSREAAKNKKAAILSLIIKSLARKDFLSKKERKDLLENKELENIILCEMQNNWIRDLLFADDLKLEEKVNLKDKVEKEMQDLFLKADRYTGEYKSLDQLRNGVYSAYEVARDLSRQLSNNEFVGTNNRLDAFYKVDFLKVAFNEERPSEIEKLFLIQVKNKNPDSKERKEIKEKHKEYINKNQPSLEKLRERKDKIIQEKVDLENDEKYIDTIWNLFFKKDEGLFEEYKSSLDKYKKEKLKNPKTKVLDDFFSTFGLDNKSLETIAIELNNQKSEENKINLLNEINRNKIVIEKEESLDREYLKNLINLFDTIYASLQSENRVGEYKVEYEDYLDNNILLAKECISQIAYFDEKRELVYEDL